MLVGTCETRPKSRELMKVMGIILRRIQSVGSVTKTSLQELCLQVQTLRRKKHKSDGCWLSFPEKAPGYKRDRSLSADRKKKPGERERAPDPTCQ